VKTQIKRDRIAEMIDEDLPRRFEKKWMDIIEDVDNEMHKNTDFEKQNQLDFYQNRYSKYPIS